MADDLSSVQENGVSDDARRERAQKVKIQLFNNLLRAQLGKNQQVKTYGFKGWVDLVFEQGSVFVGYDEIVWGTFLVCLYRDPETRQPSCMLIDKVGVSYFTPIDISKESQYYPAIENLLTSDRESEDRQRIAVILLKRFAELSEKDVRRIHPETFKFDYDPTHAGDLASSCRPIEREEGVKVGRKLLSSGFLQDRFVKSPLLDVIYEYNEDTSKSNNRLVLHLGQQLEQLFNPLTEYSPEQTEYSYKAPINDEATEQDSVLIKAISKELLELQTNFTLSLVEFLQKFVIVLRVEVLNGEIEGLSSVKLNRLFPPTIDEVTRINCIFLDSLKSATPFGSLEILKACNITIPYFYKAYTRHEAATKHFNKDIKIFLRNFGDKIPHAEVFTEMKIDSLIKGPQEKLMKIKLILDRLYASKEWAPENREESKRCYDNIIEVIDSFGRLKEPLNSYNSRVFTPSGKILTELAKGWPLELQYKWLKRRVVGVFDLVDPNDATKRKLLVIFSDYLIFLDIIDSKKNNGLEGLKPSISDIFMNSLVNEVPLPPKIPQLQVSHYCYINEVFVTLFDDNCLRFDALKGKNSFAVTYQVLRKSLSASTVADLVTKAKILEKDTAFHLFKAVEDDITMYTTAHETDAYNNENIKSKFALFLNMTPTRQVITQHKLHLALFAKFVEDTDEENVQLDVLTSDGGLHSLKVPAKNLVSTILRQLSFEIPVCFSSIYSPLLPVLLAVNESLVRKIDHTATFGAKDTKTFVETPKENIPGKIADLKNLKSGTDHNPLKSSHNTTAIIKNELIVNENVKDNISDDRFDFEEDAPIEKHHEIRRPVKQAGVKMASKEPLTPSKPPQAVRQSKNTGKQQKRRSISNVLKSIFTSKKKSDGDIEKRERSKRNEPDKKRPKSSRKRLFSTDGQSSGKTRSNTDSSNLQTNINRKQVNVVQTGTTQETVHPALDSKSNATKKPIDFDNSSEASRIPSCPPQKYDIGKATRGKRHLSLPFEAQVGTSAKETKRNSLVPVSAADASNFNLETERSSMIIRPQQSSKTVEKENGKDSLPNSPGSRESRSCGTDGEKIQTKQSSSSENLQSNSASVLQHGSNSEDDTKESSVKENEERFSTESLDRKTSRESQVFNDDLFGDVFPESKKSISCPTSNADKNDVSTANKSASVIQNNNTDLIENSVQPPRENYGREHTRDIAAHQTENNKAHKPLPQPPQLRLYNHEQDVSNEPPKAQSHMKENEQTETSPGDKTVKFEDEDKVHSSARNNNARSQPKQVSKINFERSASFVELFQGMRLVLDESDAKYNWKRLPSEYFLRDTLPINVTEERVQERVHEPPIIEGKTSEPQHAFKSIAFATTNITPEGNNRAPLKNTLNVNSPTRELTDEISSKQQDNKKFPVNKDKSGEGENIAASERPAAINTNENAFVTMRKPVLSAEQIDAGNMKKAEDIHVQDRDAINQLIKDIRAENSETIDLKQDADHIKGPSATRKKIPTFKVVDCSPTRIIQRRSPDRDSAYNIVSDISISSDLNKQVNKRLFELKFPSQDNVKDNRFSPGKSPQKVLTQDVAYVSEASTPSLHNHDDSNSTPDESIKEVADHQKDDGGLLGELDFSSFNITFDNFTKKHEEISHTSHNISKPGIAQSYLPVREKNTVFEEPIIYRLSENNESSPATYLNDPPDRKRSSHDEDPIWISPSKLDFYDINNLTESAFTNTKKKIHTVTNKSMHDMLAENSNPMKELSYAYLASMIGDEDEKISVNDRPVRLKFKE